MANYELKGGPRTPHLFVDQNQGIINILGKSTPEDARNFYRPFIEALQTYIDSEPPETQATIDLEYFNTASSKIIMGILDKLSSLANYTSVKMVWIYEEDDEEMMETGVDYQSLFGELIEIRPKKIDLS